MSRIKVSLAGLLFALLSATSYAAVETGQKNYVKACKNCHGNGAKGAALATQGEWDKLFADNASALVEKHKGDPKASAYFGGPGFKEHKQDLHDFLKEYGSDSGNTPGCG